MQIYKLYQISTEFIVFFAGLQGLQELQKKLVTGQGVLSDAQILEIHIRIRLVLSSTPA